MACHLLRPVLGGTILGGVGWVGRGLWQLLLWRSRLARRLLLLVTRSLADVGAQVTLMLFGMSKRIEGRALLRSDRLDNAGFDTPLAVHLGRWYGRSAKL